MAGGPNTLFATSGQSLNRLRISAHRRVSLPSKVPHNYLRAVLRRPQRPLYFVRLERWTSARRRPARQVAAVAQRKQGETNGRRWILYEVTGSWPEEHFTTFDGAWGQHEGGAVMTTYEASNSGAAKRLGHRSTRPVCVSTAVFASSVRRRKLRPTVAWARLMLRARGTKGRADRRPSGLEPTNRPPIRQQADIGRIVDGCLHDRRAVVRCRLAARVFSGCSGSS